MKKNTKFLIMLTIQLCIFGAEKRPHALDQEESNKKQRVEPNQFPIAQSTAEQKNVFWQAIRNNNAQAVTQHLNQFPADANYMPTHGLDKGTTPLMHAMAHDAYESFIAILALGNLVNIDLREHHENDGQLGDTALFKAISKHNLTYAEHLINRGANVNLRTTEGNTPLLQAASDGNLDAVELLLKHGADATATPNITNNTFLHNFIEYLYMNDELDLSGSQKITLEGLLDRGIDIERFNNNQHTPLMQAAMYGLYDIVVALVQAGADISHFDKENSNAILLAQSELEKIQEENYTTGMCEDKAITTLMHQYNKIIQLLSNPLEYAPAREKIAERELTKPDVGMPSDLVNIIGQYLTGPKKANQYFINQIKKAINTDDLPFLEQVLAEYPFTYFVQDETGNTPLVLAIIWKKPAAVKILMDVITHKFNENRLLFEKKIKENIVALKQIRDIKTTQLHEEQIQSLKNQLLSHFAILKKNTSNLENLFRSPQFNTAKLVELYNQTNLELARHYELLIQKLQQNKDEEHTLFQHEFDQAKATSQSVGDQEILNIINEYLEPQKNEDELMMPSEGAAPLNLLPVSFIQYLHLHTKDALEQVELHLNQHPEDLNGVDRQGNTPLMIASERENPNLAQTLIELGADKQLRNRQGLTALEILNAKAESGRAERMDRIEQLKKMLMQ